MADSKNPPVLPEGYDPELEKTNKGMAALEKERADAQAKLDARDERAKDMGKSLMKFATEVLTKQQPVKKAAGGSVKSASARADGCCIRGKTRA